MIAIRGPLAAVITCITLAGCGDSGPSAQDVGPLVKDAFAGAWSVKVDVKDVAVNECKNEGEVFKCSLAYQVSALDDQAKAILQASGRRQNAIPVYFKKADGKWSIVNTTRFYEVDKSEAL
jgi:hypothetical protein